MARLGPWKNVAIAVVLERRCASISLGPDSYNKSSQSVPNVKDRARGSTQRTAAKSAKAGRSPETRRCWRFTSIKVRKIHFASRLLHTVILTNVM